VEGLNDKPTILKSRAFVRGTNTRIEEFLEKRSYTCFNFTDKDLKEGELRKMGREIRDFIKELHKKVKVFCFFNGHGAHFTGT
jgi:hypothetical protein